MQNIKNINRIAWIGLGKVGLPMAVRLLNVGYNVTGIILEGHNKKGADILQTKGGSISCSLKKTLNNVDLIALCLPKPLDVKNFLNKYQKNLPPILLDFSTVSLQQAVDHPRILASKTRFIDIPVSGSIEDVYDGKLTLFIGAYEYEIENTALHKLFSVLGTNLFFCGKVGNGYIVKLINQFMHLSIMGLIKSTLELASQLGIDQKTVIQAISKASGGSKMLDRFGHDIINNNFTPHFTLELAHKDLKLLDELLSKHDYSNQYLNITHDIYSEALEQGLGQMNFSVICQQSLKKP